ncbi:MAG TPA: alpha/beta hydrolase-fold protein [Caulobacteraceae bacterium]|nr:alpha/beta hydrolase-fold protein [Caulobacteraceae bacterium]
MAKAKTKALPAQSPVALMGSTQFEMTSKISGRLFRIYLWRPPMDPPPEGYPVIVATDANLTFPIAATMAAATMMQTPKRALVVGVGYAADDFMTPQLRRTRDLTPPTPLDSIPRNAGLPPAREEDYGGAEDFYRFIVEELLPAVSAVHQIDPTDRTLFGHSLGGLFVLRTLFDHPDAFRNFVASSPSIWWNDRALLADEAAFSKQVRAKAIAPRVLITMGALEQTPPKVPPMGLTKRQMSALSRQARMVDNARELGARLGKLKGPKGSVFRYVEFADEDHMSVVAAALSRTIKFALSE